MNRPRRAALVLPVCACLALLGAPAASPARAGEAAAAAAPAPAPAPGPAKKVLVIAMVSEPNRRGVVEEAFRAEFAALGIEVLTSLGHLQDEDFASPDALRAKIQSLGVDGVFGLKVEYVDKHMTAPPSVGVGVGVPVYGGPAYGPYTAFVGASKPIGDAKVMANTTVRLLFFNHPGDPVWETTSKDKFNQDDLDVTSARLAKKTVKELKKKKLVIGG